MVCFTVVAAAAECCSYKKQRLKKKKATKNSWKDRTVRIVLTVLFVFIYLIYFECTLPNYLRLLLASDFSSVYYSFLEYFHLIKS